MPRHILFPVIRNDPENILRYLRDRDEKFELALQIRCKINEKTQFIISLLWGIGISADSLFLFSTVPVPVGDGLVLSFNSLF